MRYESIFLVCFSPQGENLSEKIYSALASECDATFFRLSSFGEGHSPSCDFVKKSFECAHSGKKTLLVFVGAVGIAVRLIAPFLLKKTSDPAVICVDDGGNFVVPVLSGHVGGANEAALFLSGRLGAVPVITTSTDVNGKWAYDSWCVAHGVKIENPGIIKDVSGRVLRGEKIFSVGVGCKKGVSSESLESFVKKIFYDNGLDFSLIKSISSIEIKKDERAIIDFSKKYAIPATFFSRENLSALSGSFSSSDFVLETVGLDCVCERAAIASSAFSVLLLGKQAFSGMTVAVAI